jgi:hypothetical protein
MLSKTFEFLRIADVQPNDEKVRRRKQSAADLLAQFDAGGNQEILLAFLQGVVAGFDKATFSQESPAIGMLIKAIKDQDAAFPEDLKENAVELRAVAAIVVGEMLTRNLEAQAKGQQILAALSVRSALSLNLRTSDKHLRWALETLLAASDQLLQAAALHRRRRATRALKAVNEMKETAPGAATDLWTVVVPTLRSALDEASAQAAVDREELESLWWLFTAYSELEQKSLAELSPSAAAFCSGIELAQRALLPPAPSMPAMVKRATESGRKATTLSQITLQDTVKHWSDRMLQALSSADGSSDDAAAHYPALLPLSWACRRLREADGGRDLGQEFTTATGIPLDLSSPPAEWGSQIFREKILMRVLARAKES